MPYSLESWADFWTLGVDAKRRLRAGFKQSLTPTELAEVNVSLKPAWSRRLENTE